MAKNLMVDASFVQRLLENSYELRMAAVADAVERDANLFRSNGSSLVAIGTFAEHVIVASDDGSFYRAKYALSESSGIALSDIEKIQVPIKDVREMTPAARKAADEAVSRLMRGQDATDEIMELYNLHASGVSMTAQGVEDAVIMVTGNVGPWMEAVRSGEKAITGMLGAAIYEERPTPRFSEVVKGPQDMLEKVRIIVTAANKTLRECVSKMHAMVQEAVRTPIRSDADPVAVVEFMKLRDSFASDIAVLLDLVEDAVSVGDDGDVRSLARIHDRISGMMHEMTLASELIAKTMNKLAAA